MTIGPITLFLVKLGLLSGHEGEFFSAFLGLL